MLKRYATDEKGQSVPIAKIYTEQEHPISSDQIDGDAFAITRRLKDAGFEAYIVGGAVRDLLQGKSPKDFDIATSAYPKQVRKLFRNSRIIGRRFRLVHVHYGSGKIIEVSTFRADDEEGNSNNVFGTLEDDVKRRDFSVNALYLDPQKLHIIDFVDGVKDVRAGKMKSLLPLDRTFKDDPVRMIRAVKYSTGGGFRMGWKLRRAIARHVDELERCPSSRMTEEVFKVLSSGRSALLIDEFLKTGLFRHMLPRIDSFLKSGDKKLRGAFFASLEELDLLVREKNEDRKGQMLVRLLSPFLELSLEGTNSVDLFRDTFKSCKQLLEPITPPNHEVEMAVIKLFRQCGIRTPRNITRKPKPSSLEPVAKDKENKMRRSRRRKKRQSAENTDVALDV
ncbi:polynucleotide adenylyltransferase PcnB [Sediminispirochaeta bajacaliforniensis]|uniref:polynucleotide adenylyltransferase PcnB n=1 Tax=Sediminispirochaeta bajacaliforniensis TaxID=148 RepID=UPI0003819AAE|nr:polynucleotide adenylyltransferase PcnB [Sediminispirochaeta bajacaliforniensis]